MSELPFAKKSLGQHWLSNPDALETIANLAELNSSDTVLEIGPGAGTLTQVLVEQAREVVAVEFDPELAQALPSRVSAKNLRVVNEDILKFDLTTLPVNYKVVANIPYYLTSNLLRVLCESTNPPSVIVLLVQKEVAQRVAAGPGKMSLLSVSVQFYCNVELGPIVPAKMFTPPPKVDSQILKLVYTGPRYKADTKKFFQLVKAGFSERRKKLRSSLSGGLRIDKDQTDQLLIGSGIDSDLRAQALSLDQWHALYEAFTQT
jgi:16S rRNA (adenine1518-N6/adenine1519-N6)-dimethyltransferase